MAIKRKIVSILIFGIYNEIQEKEFPFASFFCDLLCKLESFRPSVDLLHKETTNKNVEPTFEVIIFFNFNHTSSLV